MIKVYAYVFILLLVSNNSNAYMFPNQGKQYDKLILLEQLDEETSFYLSVPRKLNGSSGRPQVTISYQSIEVEEGCVEQTLPDGTEELCLPKDEYTEVLNLQSIFGDFLDFVTNKQTYDGSFEITSKVGYTVSVRVMWETELCLTFATKVIRM
jgi:hypothetical protein